MKKKKITYADQAKLILKKYEKRLGKNFTNNDKLAKDALDRELTELKNKQEAFKAQEQQVQIETMMKKGGKLPIYKEPNKNNNYGNLPKEDDYGLMNDGYIDRFDANTLVQGVPIKRPTDFEGNEVDVGYTPLDLSQFDISPEQEAALMAGKEAENLKFALNANNFKLPTNTSKETIPQNTDTLYSGASGLPLVTSLAGNALLYGSASRYGTPEDVRLERMEPQEISLAREREAAKRDADMARNTSLRNARGLGLNAGAAATLGVASLADINRVSGDRISKSYLNEELANKQSKDIASRVNAELGAKETLFNASRGDEYKATTTAMKNQAIQNILQDIGQYSSDQSNIKRSTLWANAYSPTYKIQEDPDQTRIDKFLKGTKMTGSQDTSGH